MHIMQLKPRFKGWLWFIILSHRAPEDNFKSGSVVALVSNWFKSSAVVTSSEFVSVRTSG